jgi:hypothetical protein
MLYKLLSIDNYTPTNIGDYVQALAASQYLPRIDGFINRENLSEYNGEDSKVIMNGWYMHNPKKWPPCEKIYPLFVSLHLNISAEKEMLSPEGIKYFKQHEPIGCRDEYTRDNLLRHGVEAYFSGCLTLTLGNKYTTSEKRSDVYFVDPYIPKENGLGYLLRDSFYLVAHIRQTIVISKQMKVGASGLKNILRVARFGRLYSRVFSKDTLINARYITQENECYSSLSNNERLKEAERLVRLYAKAALVVTSRIHCALPSLGLGTPVYLVRKANDKIGSSCRMGGLEELFNTIKVSADKAECTFHTNGKLSLRNMIPNKESWKPLAKALSERCYSFINNQ